MVLSTFTMLDFFQQLFSPIVSVLGIVLLFFHQTLGIPWWLSIALLTVVLRTLLFPLTIRQVRSMKAMQDLRPEMERIRTEYKDDPQEQQQELMKLYRESGVNPLGGCLPVLIQAPIFIGIFYVIRKFGGTAGIIGGGAGTTGTQQSFEHGGILWFTDLTASDPYFILPVVSAVTLLLAMEISNRQMESQQRWLMRLLPIVVTFFTWTFPAGLFMYWITSNLVTMIQNYLIYHHGPGRGNPTSETGG